MAWNLEKYAKETKNREREREQGEREAGGRRWSAALSRSVSAAGTTKQLFRPTVGRNQPGPSVRRRNWAVSQPSSTKPTFRPTLGRNIGVSSNRTTTCMFRPTVGRWCAIFEISDFLILFSEFAKKKVVFPKKNPKLSTKPSKESLKCNG